MLSRDDIRLALTEGHLKIFPFESKNLTGIGYNLSTTDFAFSINQGILLTIHHKITDDGVERYVTIPANDTALFFSKEYIEIDHTLAGTFHSKVFRVSEGLGHISTTLDPTWKGQLLISINNPTSKGIKFDLDKSGGNIMTMLLHKLDSPVTGDNIHDNNKGRCELLIAHFANPLSNSACREKHLELRAFVENELADSLNGYDSFLGSDYPGDRYSSAVECLTRLRNRLQKDMIIIQEDRYALGEDGKYFYLKSVEEEQLLKDCVLFSLKSQPFSSSSLLAVDKFHLKDALPVIKQYINVINYELDMINHIRRIKWQNDRVGQFANEDSELVKMRQEAEKAKRQSRIWIPLVILIAVMVGMGFVWRFIFPNSDSREVVLVTFVAPVVASIVQWWSQYWHK